MNIEEALKLVVGDKVLIPDLSGPPGAYRTTTMAENGSDDPCYTDDTHTAIFVSTRRGMWSSEHMERDEWQEEYEEKITACRIPVAPKAGKYFLCRNGAQAFVRERAAGMHFPWMGVMVGGPHHASWMDNGWNQGQDQPSPYDLIQELQVYPEGCQPAIILAVSVSPQLRECAEPYARMGSRCELLLDVDVELETMDEVDTDDPAAYQELINLVERARGCGATFLLVQS